MHEFSLATEILDTALAAARESGAGNVTAVHITMAPTSHIDGSVLADAFEIAAAGTCASEASLDVATGDHGKGEVAVTAIDVDP